MDIPNSKSDISSKEILAVFGIILASVAFVMELTLLPMVLTVIQADIDLDISQLSWIFNSYAIAVAIAVLVTGMIGDRIEKNRIFFFGVMLFFIGSTLSALSENFGHLVFGRMLQGVGGGLFSPLVPILLARAFPKAPGKILIIWGGLAGIVATVMPFVGGGLIWCFGWRIVFGIISAVALISLIIATRTLVLGVKVRQNIAIDYSKFFYNIRIWFMSF